MLSLIQGDAAREDEELAIFVRGVRRDMARLLRALRSSGRGPSSFPDSIATRLAHVDTVTARFLIDGCPASRAKEARAAAQSMRNTERWILESLSAEERNLVRARELTVRVEESELARPVLRTEWTGEELSDAPETGGPRSMRYGLSCLNDRQLAGVCRRLGIRIPGWNPRPVDSSEGESPDRSRAEQAVLETLLDSHLLAILLATLAQEAHGLLAALVRGDLDGESRERILREPDSDRAFYSQSMTPAQQLRSCALVFEGGEEGGLWVPMEIHRRVDGVLRAFGV